TIRWNSADNNENRATAGPSGYSHTVTTVPSVGSVPGGPPSQNELIPIRKSFESTTMAIAETRCSAASERFQIRSRPNDSSETGTAGDEGSDDSMALTVPTGGAR